MDDLARLLIERDCLRLMTAYCTYLDNRDTDTFLDLFTPEATWIRIAPLPPIDLPGREAIRAFFDRRSTASVSRHLVINPVVDVIDADNAKGVSFGLVVRGPAGDGTLPVPMRGLELLVEYRDTFVRTAAGWKFARREMLRLIDVEAKPTAAGG